MTLLLCFSTKYTFRLEKKLRDTDCFESRSDRLSSWERPHVFIGPEVRQTLKIENICMYKQLLNQLHFVQKVFIVLDCTFFVQDTMLNHLTF